MASKNSKNTNFNKKQNTKIENGVFIYSGSITLDQLCKSLQIQPSEVIKSFMMKGQLISLNTTLSEDLVAEVCIENGFDFKKEQNANVDDFTTLNIFNKEKDKDPRPCIVTIMGHVDHGKTTLVDSIRHSRITEIESGGITQAIGAYQKTVNGKKITFIDTPGHEAFTAMRARGAKMTDIVVLVVAYDDGVKPQTVEAINHAKAAKVPIIVAINKMDKPGASSEKVKSQLAGLDLIPEDWGGNTMTFEISAKKNIGINELLDGILTQAEMLELTANNNQLAVGSVIEAKLDKKEGAKATLLVQNGTLHISDCLAIGGLYCKVRRITNEFNKAIKVATPSTPVVVTGISGVPTAGDRFMAFETEQQARDAAYRHLQSELQNKNTGVSLADLATSGDDGDVSTINLLVKTDTQGSLEAIVEELKSIDISGAKLNIVHAQAGEVSLSDITLAEASKAIIVAFNLKTGAQINDLAKEKKIEIRSYDVIYHLQEDIINALKGTLAPTYEEVTYGQMEIRSLFKASKIGQIAGCQVIQGKIINGTKVRVYRKNELVLTTTLSSLKRFKDDVKEVVEGFDCGCTIKDNFNLEEGDILESFGKEIVKDGR